MKHKIKIVQWHPHRLNEFIGCHWTKMAKMKKEDAQIVGIYAIKASVPRAECKRKVRVVMLGWKYGRLPDKDAYDKSLLDALVSAQMLLDDSSKYLEGRMEVELRRSSCKSTTIHLEDVEDV